MCAMIMRQPGGIALEAAQSSLLAAFKSDAAVVAIQDRTVAIQDLAQDFRRFQAQRKLVELWGKGWPSIAVQGHQIKSTDEARWRVPIDLWKKEAPPADPDAAQQSALETVERARQDNLPLSFEAPAAAENAFLTGAAHAALNRASWLKPLRLLPQPPNVTVDTYPQGQQVLYTSGHFFSVGVVFGISSHSQRIAAGIYSFWLSAATPSTALPLWNITADTRVTV